VHSSGVWNAYGIAVAVEPAGAMVAHSEIAYLIDQKGRVRVILNSDPAEDRADEILFRGTRRGRATTSPDGVMSRPVLRKSRLFRRATRAFMLGALVALLAACSSADNAPATTAKLSSPPKSKSRSTGRS